jgi:GDPmannose 4,6-dehydratase
MQWRMLQQEEAEDFVIATGVQHSVREFVTLAAKVLNIELAWKGAGIEETAVNQNGETVVAVDPQYAMRTRSWAGSPR